MFSWGWLMMLSNNMLLIKTFLRSTSSINILRFSKDKAKLRYAKNSLIGQVILYVILTLYATLFSVGIASSGQAKVIPELCAILLFFMPFMFTLFKANGYLFGFKEYDMIMSMPFEVKSIVSSKFWYMYIKSIPMYALISLSMIIGYAFGGYLTFWSFISWIVITFTYPLIPMIIASALGAVTVRIGAKFKYKSIVQALLTAILIIPIFFSRYFIENTVRNDEMEEVIYSISAGIKNTSSYIPFAGSFSEAINDGIISSLLLLVASTIIIYELFFVLISKFYRKMNSQLSSGTNSKKYVLTSQAQNSIVKSVAFKEFKRMTGSSVYLVNAGLGQIMVTIFGIAMLILKPDVVIKSMLQGAPIEASVLFPALPILFYFFLGMVPTTACSPSLEGKNYWIMKTLPISPMEDCKGKILFNLYMSIPFAVFATISASICFRVSVIDAIMSIIALCSLCVFSTISGLRSGLKHRRLDWENEIEVIKQGMAVSMYIIPHIIIGLILMPLVVAANYYFHNIAVIMLFITLFACMLTLVAYKGVKKYM